MAALKDRDFEKLFMTYKNEIYKLAYTYVHNEADALDIVQETAYQAYVSRKALKDREKFKSWVLTITVNKSLDHLKKKRPVPVEDITLYSGQDTKREDSLFEFEEKLKTLTLNEKNIMMTNCQVKCNTSPVSAS